MSPSDRARSETHEPLEDSDAESHSVDEGKAGGKPGRKKNPNSTAARRDQNRIAQRDFRLRKQQRIRDLEARVELLSGSRDDALYEMRMTLKDLMAENHQLRGLVRGLSTFIGEGSGGLLSKLGWDMNDFNAFINKGETDTAYESYTNRKKGRGDTGGDPKRPAEDAAGGPAKRARPSEDSPRSTDFSASPGVYSSVVSMNTAVPSAPMTSMTTGRTPPGANLFHDLMPGPSSFMPLPPGVPPIGPQPINPPTSSGASSTSYQQAFVPQYMTQPADASLTQLPYSSGPTPPAAHLGSVSQSAERELDSSDDPKKHEANKLLHYHLDNYKRNRKYCLPVSLRPTLVQKTVGHEGVIDGIIHPELRDRFILLRGRFDLVDCLHEYMESVTIHGDDVLAHTNWEIGEGWLRKYGYLVDQATLSICNRWRRERASRELQLSDITPPDAGETMA